MAQQSESISKKAERKRETRVCKMFSAKVKKRCKNKTGFTSFGNAGEVIDGIFTASGARMHRSEQQTLPRPLATLGAGTQGCRRQNAEELHSRRIKQNQSPNVIGENSDLSLQTTCRNVGAEDCCDMTLYLLALLNKEHHLLFTDVFGSICVQKQREKTQSGGSSGGRGAAVEAWKAFLKNGKKHQQRRFGTNHYPLDQNSHRDKRAHSSRETSWTGRGIPDIWPLSTAKEEAQGSRSIADGETEVSTQDSEDYLQMTHSSLLQIHIMYLWHEEMCTA
ncbi:uncharacterized protein [Heterodontus francisci]|uniref:uncharacterized protein n=1 Tax=Heterodontus francisci TaxID=7792 RepID=UPI00355BDCC6